jgi:hypothetical protein
LGALRAAATTPGQPTTAIFSHRKAHRTAVNVIRVSVLVSVLVLDLVFTKLIVVVETIITAAAATASVGVRTLLVVETKRRRQRTNVNKRGGETLRRMRRYRVAADIARVLASASGTLSSADCSTRAAPATAAGHRA